MNNNDNNQHHVNNFNNNNVSNVQNNQGQPGPNFQMQFLASQPNGAALNTNQSEMTTQQQLSNMNSKLQRSGILMQNLAIQGERSAQQGTNGSQIFQEPVRNRRPENDEICALRGANKAISLNEGQELQKRKNTKRQTEQVMQADAPASGFCSSLKSSIEGVDLDDKADEQLDKLNADSLDINSNLLHEKQRKGPGYHSKFYRQQNRMTKQKDTHKAKDDKTQHFRGESIQISLNIKKNFPAKLHLQPLTASPNKQIRGQQRPITCMSEGYQREGAREASHLVDNAPSSLHLSPLAQQQNCCPYNCFHPFVMGDNSFDIPAALFLNLICHHVNMPDEHAIVVLALIDRFCNKVVDLNYNCNRFYKRLPNESRQQDTGEEQPQVQHCCTQMTINPQTIHKLILTSVLVTQKFYSDIFYSNNYFTNKCGFIEVEELNRLEEIFLDVIDWNLTVDFDEYQTYDNGLQQFFEAPLQPETIRIIDENHEAYNNFLQNQNQQMFNQEFEQWSHQSAQRLQMLERIIQQQQQQGPNQMLQNLPQENNNTGESSEVRQTSQSMQLLQELMDNGANMNQVAAGLNPGQGQVGNLGGLGALHADFGQQHAGMPNPIQDASQLNMHLLNIAIACEMQRQQSLNQQISILASLLQQLQLHEQQQQQNNGNNQAPLP